MKKVRSILFRVPDDDRRLLREAEVLASICDKEYMLLTGKPNKDKNGLPIVAVQNTNRWWELVSNDPDFDTAELAANIRKWDGSPLLEGKR